MMRRVAIVFTLAAVAFAASTVQRAVKLPEYFPEPCTRSLPTAKLNECIKKNMQAVIPHFSKGEKLFGLESLEPIPVSDIQLNFHREPFDFRAAVRHTKVIGVTSLIVRAVRAKLTDSDMHLELDITIPKLVIEGDMKMDGRFGNFPYSGKGPYNVSFTDLEATWSLIGNAVQRDGEKYMELKRYIPDYTVSDMKFYAENLVDGAPDLTSLAVNLMNQFWEPVLRAMKPATNPELEKVMKRMANSVFTSIPFDRLFPAA